MEIKAKLVLDPTALKTGKERAACIRKHAHLLASCIRAYRPHLTHGQLRYANQLDKLMNEDPAYWLRRKGTVCNERDLERLLAQAKGIQNTSDQYPAVLKLLKDIEDEILKDLILTKQEQGWAILRLSKKVIAPHLQTIRRTGCSIAESVWGPHISVVRGEVNHWKLRTKYWLEEREYSVNIGDTIRQNRKGYYWLDCQSAELEEMRVQLGLPPRPAPPFHLTIGKRN